MHRLPQSASLEKSDAFIGGMSTRERNNAIQVPTSIRGTNIGGQAAAVQSVISWARRFPGAEMRTYESTLTAKQLRSPHFLAAVLMSGKVTSVAGEDITLQARRLAIERLRQLAVSTDLGPSLVFAAADHTSIASPATLYVREDGAMRVRRPDELRRIVRTAIAQQDFTSSEAVTDVAAQILRELIHEIFDNTHRHARSTSEATPLNPSVRMVVMRGVSGTVANLHSAEGPTSSLGQYIAHPELEYDRPNASIRGMRRFIELSVVDSGIGMPERAASTRAILADQIDAVAWCLRKNLGSSRVSHRGQGFPRMMRLLTQAHGYMRIRTGAVEFVRDFIAQPATAEEAERGEAAASDWLVRSAIDGLDEAAGTLVTVVIPMSSKWAH